MLVRFTSLLSVGWFVLLFGLFAINCCLRWCVDFVVFVRLVDVVSMWLPITWVLIGVLVVCLVVFTLVWALPGWVVVRLRCLRVCLGLVVALLLASGFQVGYCGFGLLVDGGCYV